MQHMPDHRVLRFEFSAALIHAVTAFVGTHRYDDRKTYKEAWTAWLLTQDTAALLDAEHARLNNLGYTGDVADKLFKSARYYFRGKLQQQSQPTRRRRRQKYVAVNRTLLDAMDEHIERGITTPALGFAHFCTAHAEDAVLQTEVASLFARYNNANNANNAIKCTSDTQIMQEVLHKLKKTYKNRCFMQTHKRTRARVPFQNNNATK
jgi:hypothetical protein